MELNKPILIVQRWCKMKEIWCTYTILRCFEVEDNATYDEINKLVNDDLYELGIYDNVTDIEWDEYKREE